MDTAQTSSGYMRAMRRYATFSGRSTRAEFWLFTLVSALIGVMGQIIDIKVGTQHRFYILVSLIHFLPSVAASVRRLHDTNRSGWLFLLVFTIIGAIPLLVFFCQRGTPGPNSYGAEDGPASAPALAAAPMHTGSTVAATAPVGSAIAEIERLADLKARGVLSETEFETLKAKSLGAPANGRVEPRF